MAKAVLRRLAALLAAAMLLGGCAVGLAVRNEPGIDLSVIMPGVTTREAAEVVLGKPIREWTTALAVRYCIYSYYGGARPEYAGAATLLFLDVISLGLAELFYQLDPEVARDMAESGKRYPLVAVSYDTAGRVIGMFPEFDQFAVLPPDGRPPASANPAEQSGHR